MYVIRFVSMAFAQSATVEGTVSDANTGELLPGVNILLLARPQERQQICQVNSVLMLKVLVLNLFLHLLDMFLRQLRLQTSISAKEWMLALRRILLNG
jgi:hypothetical protein